MRRIMLAVLGAQALAGWWCASSAAEDVTEARDVVYAVRDQADGTKLELKMNVYRPEPEGAGEASGEAAGERDAKACIIVIHGGGWAAGKREDMDGLARHFAQRGFVATTISYRLAPVDPFPAQVIDCADAVKFMRRHAAEYGIDPDRIGAVGVSAGAHLSMMLATVDPGDGLGVGPDGAGEVSGKVQAAVSVVGPTLLNADDVPVNTRGIVDGFIGAGEEGRDERCVKASPLTYVSAGDGPMLLFAGTEDPLVPATQALRMVAAMGKAGVPGRAELIAGAGHGWMGEELERTLEASTEFFELHLKAKPQE